MSARIVVVDKEEVISLADAENIKIDHVVDVQIIVYDVKCVGDILGTEFCWPKEKKSKYKIAFYTISEVMSPKNINNTLIRAKGQS